MSFKNENDVCIIANRKMIVSAIPLEKIKRAAELKKIANENAAEASRKKTKKKDPTDALGNFISELDVYTIEKNIDFESIDKTIRRILKENGNNLEALIDEKIIYHLCKSFDYNIRELIELLMEKYPKNFNLSFVKSKVKPFIVNLQKEKEDYLENDSIQRPEYKSIFSVL